MKIVLLFALFLPTTNLFAHHSAPAFFDTRGFTSAEGVITGNRLENPHSYYRLSTDDGVDWAWESGDSWTALSKLGWTQETLPVGSRVRMSGIPARVDRPIARFDHITVFDVDGEGGVEIYGLVGNSDWVGFVRDQGSVCSTGIEDCRYLTQGQFSELQNRFDETGIWSPLVE